MADVLLFHHIQGLTPGVVGFADALRAAGHTVHTPDLFDGRTFDSIPEGAKYAHGDGAPDFDVLADKVAADLPAGLVYAGFSMGAAQAQRLAQTRPGAAGALLFESCIPLTGEWAFGPWPDGVPVQVHGKDDDEFFAHEGDLDAARELVATVPDAELFTYPGPEHLFADSTLASYDAEAAALLTERVLEFLARRASTSAASAGVRASRPLRDAAHGGADLRATDTRNGARSSAISVAYQSGSRCCRSTGCARRRSARAAEAAAKPAAHVVERRLDLDLDGVAASPGTAAPRGRGAGRGPAGGVNGSASTSTEVTRSMRYIRRASAACDQPRTYHRPCRTTTAHGSTCRVRSRCGPSA